MTLIFTYREPVSFSPRDGSPLPRKVHFAADRMANDGVRYTRMVTPKYRTYGVNNDFVFAFCGDLRIGQLLSHSIDGIDDAYNTLYETQKLDSDFIIEDVVTKFQESLRDAGFNPNDFHNPLNFDGVLISPTRKVFIIGGDLSVCELEDPLWTTGSGEVAARAVWDVLNDLSWDVFEKLETIESRIHETYRYVSRNDMSVSEEIDYLVLD